MERDITSETLFEDKDFRGNMSNLSTIYISNKNEIYEAEAEQSRLMTAISAGQELMSSYFNLLREAGTCAVAQMKTIEWKLGNHAWWVSKRHHDYLPCLCPAHNRTPLDVLRIKMSIADESQIVVDREDKTPDITQLHSSFITTLSKI